MIVPHQVFQAHCGERSFKYAGEPGKFHVSCRLGPDKCNREVCPIWNSNRVKPINNKEQKQEIEGQSLRDVNLALKEKKDAK